MKKRKIGDDKYIVFMNNKYFVVNLYTFNLLELYNENKDIKYLSNKLGVGIRKTKKIYKNLTKEISNIEYYEDNINLDFPLKLQWKITNRCNLQCKHCYLGKLNQKELSDEELINIAKKICNSNIMEVTITGGEALLVKKLPDIVAMLINNDIRVNIFTNGLLLKKFLKELYKLLGEHPVDKLFFYTSIDGNEKSHDFIRGKGNFLKTIANIKNVIDYGYKVTTNTVLSTMNYKDVPELYKQLYELNIYKIQISNLIDTGSATKDMMLSKEQKNNFLSELKKVLSKLDDGSKLLYAEVPDETDISSEVYLLNSDKKEYIGKENWKCSAGIGKATINYDGEVYCCPFIKKYSLGNITTKEFSEIWSCQNRFDFLKELVKSNNNSRVCIAMKQRKGGE